MLKSGIVCHYRSIVYENVNLDFERGQQVHLDTPVALSGFVFLVSSVFLVYGPSMEYCPYPYAFYSRYQPFSVAIYHIFRRYKCFVES